MIPIFSEQDEQNIRRDDGAEKLKALENVALQSNPQEEPHWQFDEDADVSI